MSNLIYSSTTEMTQADWLAFRSRGIGASEVGYIMGLSPYKSNVELFYEKISSGIKSQTDSVPAFMGRYMEDKIAELWQYWKDDQITMQENYKQGKKVRTMQRVNAYIQNPKFPHLFVSLDRRINKHGGKGNGCLEIKTLGGYEANKWEAGVPPQYIVQLNTQMMVTGWRHGELAIMEDGRYLNVHEFKPHKGIYKAIQESTTDFWNRVTEARKALTQKFEAEQNFNTSKVMELEARLQQLEPDPDSSVSLSNFLNSQYKEAVTLSERDGTLEEYEIAMQNAQFKQQRNELDKNINLGENKLKTAMRETEVLNFGAAGKVIWKNTSSGARRFVNKIDVKE